MKTILAVALLGLVLGGCGGDNPPEDFSRSYLTALEKRPGTPVQSAWLDAFVDAYGDFTGQQLGDRIRATYAPDLYFNDTLRSIDNRKALVSYLTETAERLESMELTILDQHYSGTDAYLRWTMRTRFQAGWNSVDTTTLGMTHLRFDGQGRVVLHQDFWDSRQGIFEHIPVMGGMIAWLRKRL